MWRPPWRWFERLAAFYVQLDNPLLQRGEGNASDSPKWDASDLLDLMSPTRQWLTPWRGVPASAKRAKVRDWLRSSDLGVVLIAVLRRLSYDDRELQAHFLCATQVSWIVAIVVVSVAFDSLLEGFLNLMPPTGFDPVTFRLWGDNHQSFGLFKVILNDRRCCRRSAAELQGLYSCVGLIFGNTPKNLVLWCTTVFGFFFAVSGSELNWWPSGWESGFQPLDHTAHCELLETTCTESIY